MGIISRACSTCGTKPEPRVAEHVTGRHGETIVEFENFPYKACDCGRVARWAFDPGTDLSAQLFEGGIPFARGTHRNPTCRQCGSRLGVREPVELEAEVHLNGFQPIRFRTRLSGYVCAGCGLQQATPGAFDTGHGGGGSEGAEALMDAVRAIGLS